MPSAPLATADGTSPKAPRHEPREPLRHQIGEAFELVGWLYRDVIATFGWRLFRIGCLEIVSIGLAGLVLTAVVKAARVIDGRGVLALPGGQTILDVPAGAGFELLGGLFLILGIGSAVTSWRSDRIMHRTAAEYAHVTLMRALDRLDSPEPSAWAVGAGRPPRAIAQISTQRAPNVLQLWCLFAFQSIRPTVLLVVAAIALVVIDPSLTLMLLPLLPIYAFVLARLSAWTRESDATWRDAHAAFQALLQRRQANAHQAADDTVVDLAGLETMHAEVNRHFQDRRSMTSHGQLANGVLLALTLALIFVSAAADRTAGQASWAGLILYVLGLRYVVAGLRANTSLLVRLQLQRHNVDPYRRLVGAEAPPAVALHPEVAKWLVPADGEGAPALLILPWKPSELDRGLAAALVPSGPDGWRIHRIGDGKARPYEAPGRTLLIARSGISTERLLQRAGGAVRAVAVWDGTRWLGAGDWEWYEAHWAELCAELATGDAPADDGEVVFED